MAECDHAEKFINARGELHGKSTALEPQFVYVARAHSIEMHLPCSHLLCSIVLALFVLVALSCAHFRLLSFDSGSISSVS